MVRLKIWQWLVLILPIAAIVGFITAAAGFQIHQWHLNWIWAVIVLLVLGWRWLLVQWLRPPQWELEDGALGSGAMPEGETGSNGTSLQAQAEAEIQRILVATREDVLPWEDWSQFFSRCQALIEAIAHIYAPQVKRPFLNIYVPQAYGLLRDTVDDVDRWMQKLSPALGQVTIGQAYAAYETYQKLEPTARAALKILDWSRWWFNPVAAVAKTATQSYGNQANQQLLANLGQIVRETTLKALGERAIALYGGQMPQPFTVPERTVAAAQTQTLRQIFDQYQSTQTVAQTPLNVLLVGRTGAGKSSVINTLFRQELAEVDVLPSTEQLQSYTFTTPTGDTLCLWDAPGYEQVARRDLRELVLEKALEADLLLLVTPATDPALQMDQVFLAEVTAKATDLPAIAVITQVDRLRPFREWDPPYDWQQGERPKEQAIQGAVAYREEIFGAECTQILPLVTADIQQNREAWGISALSQTLVDIIEPANQIRLTRFLQDVETRVHTAAKIIDTYAAQMGTQQGLATLLKSPILGFLSTLTTGSPALAQVLAAKIPIEQSPVVMGKLQMAYELFSVVADESQTFDLLLLWPLLLESAQPVSDDAWAFGHTLVEYWAGNGAAKVLGASSLDTLRRRYQQYLEGADPPP